MYDLATGSVWVWRSFYYGIKRNLGERRERLKLKMANAVAVGPIEHIAAILKNRAGLVDIGNTHIYSATLY